MFRDPDCADDPWHLMRQLQEDEFIQLQERPQLAAHQEAVRALIAQMLATFAKRQDLNRGSLMRAAAKRLLRLGAVVELDAIDRPGLHVLMAEMAERAVQTVERDHAGTKTN